MKPSNCTFISLENIEILCKIRVVLRKKNRKKQYNGFPHFYSDVACFLVTQGILPVSVFVLWIDCAPIGRVINSCQIAIYVPGGFFHIAFLGLLCLSMFFACPGKTL